MPAIDAAFKGKDVGMEGTSSDVLAFAVAACRVTSLVLTPARVSPTGMVGTWSGS